MIEPGVGNMFRYVGKYLRVGIQIGLKVLLLAIVSLLATLQATAYSGDHYRVCNLDPQGENFLALREAPMATSRLVMRLPSGYDVEVRGPRKNGRWFPVATVDEKGSLIEGYVFDAFVCPVGKPRISQ
uniref:SH3 domain-containing protein n=1 Tax=Microbulbifer agarilyticus TaxID=260552 RepID=UPI001110D442|nr:SH3 domain-containing protein [Microbulbifer agarilyticus]